MPPSRILFAVTLLVLLPAVAAAGSVEGRLYWSRQAAAADSAHQRDAFSQLQTGIDDAVISLEPSPAKLERRLSKAAKHARTAPGIDQRSMQFVPRVMVLATGDSVLFTNSDSLYHNVFSVSTACHFDLGRMRPGRVEVVHFDHPGVINLHCELHPDMIGYVVVLPQRLYTRPDATGSFELPNLPKGHYVLRVWHPRRGELARAFDVPRRGSANLALVF